MRKVYVLPSLITCLSMLCGLLAILNVLNVAESTESETHQYVLSCWLILVAAVLDLLDGLVARLTRTESLFGAQLDSLADVVAFGVAPAVLIYTRMENLENRHLAEGTATFFAICGALRLARFNVQKTKVEKKSFTGMPIPAAAGMVVSSFLFFQRIDPDWDKHFVLMVLPIMLVGLSFLMVSTVSYPSFKQLRLERRKQFSVLPAIFLLLALGIFMKDYIEALVFFGFVAYTAVGIIGEVTRPVWQKKRSRRHPPADTRPVA
ncbi:MAG: CDP-diacylglycerol--serine O-phosphatidyltransferase [Candidatus Sumerlaeaceae bacterium]